MIVAVLVAIVLNTVDRQMLALIKPLLDGEFGWSALSYGRVTAAGQLAAALCLPIMGWIVDTASPRRCFAWGVALWSCFTAAQALAMGPASMLAIRIGLTGAEAMGTPAALKVLGTIAPTRRRAFALGLFNMAPSLGAMVGPLLISLLAWRVGWRWCAVFVGGSGLLWVAWWLRVSASASAAPERPATQVSRDALGPAVWLLVSAKALTDQLWWVFLYWLPDVLGAQGGGAANPVIQLTSIYVWAALGSLCGAGAVAWTQHLRRGTAQRWIAGWCLAIAALLVIASQSDHPTRVAACALAIFGHQTVSVLIFSAIGEERFVRRTGTISGIGGFAGNLLAVGSLALVGRSIQWGLGYGAVFVGLAVAYLAGATCLIGARQLGERAPRGRD